MGGLFGGGKQPQAQKQQPAGALQIQTSVFGSAYPLIYGKTRVPMNLIHYFNFRPIAHVEQQKTGGKGGGKKQTNTTYTYTTAFAGGIAVGGIAGVGTVWKNKEKHTLASLGLTLFNGAAGQTVWPFLASSRPTENFPYANLAYVAASAFDLGDSTALPNLNFEVKGLCGYGAGNDDALASDIIADYLGNARHGAGFGAYLEDLDAGANSFRKYCLARGLFLSPAEMNQRPAGAFIQEIADICNSAIVWRNGKMNLIPYGDTTITGNGATYTPDLTPLYDLTLDDFLYEPGQPPIKHKEKPAEQQFNHHRIEYKSRANDYNPLVVDLKDQADIDQNGLRSKAVTKMDMVVLDNVARDVLQLMQQRDLHVNNTYSFRLGVRHSLLEPMDLVTITDISPVSQGLGLNRQLVRILDVVEIDDAIDVTVEELNVGVAHAPAFSTQGPLGYNQDYNASAGVTTDPLIMNAPGLLTPSGYEQWIAVAGTNANYGGCIIWVSDDNVNYRRVGECYGSAHYGSLTTAMPAGTADDDTTSVARVQLYTGTMLPATQNDRDNWRSIMYIGGEWVSYRDATLVSGTTYDIANFKRAGYGSTRASHAIGQGLARIDEAIFRLPYDPGNIGKTVYFKFQAFNVFGGGLQDLSTCTPYTHVMGASETTAPMTYLPIAGMGQNFVPDIYSRFNKAIASLDTTTTPAIYDGSNAITFATVADATAASGYVLRATTATTNNTLDWGYFSTNASAPNIFLQPGKKYILSYKAKASVAGHSIRPFVRHTADGVISYGTTQALTTTMTRYSTVIDLTAVTGNELFNLAFYFNASGVAGRTVDLDQIMIEQLMGLVTEPSTWVVGTSMQRILDLESDIGDAQATADAAATDAASSLNQLSDIASDTKLTANEKIKARQEYSQITTEQAGINAEADRYAVSHAAYDSAMTTLKTYLNGLGLVDGSYNWTNITGTTTIVSATWDTNWTNVYVNRQTVLNSIAAKVGNQMQNGVMVPPAYGSELVINGSFESVNAGQASTGTHVVGTVLCDAWEIMEQSGNGAIMRCGVENSGSGARAGTRTLFIGALNSGTVVVPNGSNNYVIAAQRGDILVTPGEQYLLNCAITENGSARAAGLGRTYFVGMRFYDSAGSLVGTDNTSGVFGQEAFGSSLAASMNPTSDRTALIPVPAGAVRAKIIAYNNLYNISGSNQNVVANQSHVRIDSVSIKRIDSLGVSPNMLRNTEWLYGVGPWGNVVAGDIVKRDDSYRIQRSLNATNWFPYQDVDTSVQQLFPGERYSASVEIGWGGTITGTPAIKVTLQALNSGGGMISQIETPYFSPNATTQPTGTKLLNLPGLLLPIGTQYLRLVGTVAANAGDQITVFWRKPKVERNAFCTPYVTGADGLYGNELTYAGSSRQIGDLRNINPVGHANVGSAWISGAITYTSAAGSPATATISMSAGTLRLGGVDIAYNASSVGVTGTNGTNVTYQLYYDDPTYAGGTRTLAATTTFDTLINGLGRVYVGKVTVAFPASGSGGGGGGTPCVMSSAFVPEGKGYRRMGDVRAAEVMVGFNPLTMQDQPMIVSSQEEVMADCIRVVCENGCVLPCSVYAKVWVKDKGWTLAPNLLGQYLWTRKRGVYEWSLVTDIVRVGQQLVNHVVGEIEGEYDTTGAFAAGEEPDMYVFGHHNIKNTP